MVSFPFSDDDGRRDVMRIWHNRATANRAGVFNTGLAPIHDDSDNDGFYAEIVDRCNHCGAALDPALFCNPDGDYHVLPSYDNNHWPRVYCSWDCLDNGEDCHDYDLAL